MGGPGAGGGCWAGACTSNLAVNWPPFSSTALPFDWVSFAFWLAAKAALFQVPTPGIE